MEQAQPTNLFIAGEPETTGSYDALFDDSNLQGPPSQRHFDIDRLPPDLLLPRNVERISNVDLELDGVAADILNNNEMRNTTASASTGACVINIF